MGTFYHPPPPFMGGSQPHEGRQLAPSLLDNPTVEKPPYRPVLLIAAVLTAWIAPDPSPFMGGRQPLQARTLPPQITAVAVNDPSGSAQVMRIVEVAPVPPQRPRQLNPALLNNPPVADASVPFTRPWLSTVASAWADQPSLPQTKGGMSPGIPGQSVDPPPRRLTQLSPSLWQVADVAPQQAKQLSPGIPGQSVDQPPFSQRRQPNAPTWVPPDPPPTLSGKLSPGIPGQSVDQPQFSQRRQPHAPTWIPPDPLPTLVGKLSPGIPGQSVDAVSRAPAAPQGVLQAWVPPDPLPTLSGKLSAGIPGQSVDPPPRWRAQLPPTLWQPPDPLPTLAARLVQPFTPSTSEDPPFSSRKVPHWPSWTPDDPLPTLSGKLNPSITAVPVNDPPFSSRRAIHWPLWQVVDPPPTLNAKTVQPFVAAQVDNPSGAAVPRLVLVDPLPLPQSPKKIAAILAPQTQGDNPPFNRRPVPIWTWDGGFTIVTAAAGTPDSVDNPPFGAFYTSNNIVPLAWLPPGQQPTLRKGLPPSALAVPVNDPPFSQRRQPYAPSWTPPDPLPTLTAKLVQPFVVSTSDNPPFTARRVPHWPLWQPPDPLPIVARNLPPSITAVAVNDPPFSQRSSLSGILTAWLDPPAQPQTEGKLSPGIPGQSIDNPPRLRRLADAAVSPDPLPTLPGKLSPGIPGQSVDQPPRWREPPRPPAPEPYVHPQRSGLLSPGIPGQSVDQPPSLRRPVADTAWRPSDFQPILSVKLAQPATADSIGSPRRYPMAVWYTWREPDPLPTSRPKLPVSVTAVPVNDPPFGHFGRLQRNVYQSWVPPDPQPQHFSPVAIQEAIVTSPTFVRRPLLPWPSPAERAKHVRPVWSFWRGRSS